MAFLLLLEHHLLQSQTPITLIHILNWIERLKSIAALGSGLHTIDDLHQTAFKLLGLLVANPHR